jgi:hypothetical protein
MTRSVRYHRIATLIDDFVDSLTQSGALAQLGGRAETIGPYAFDDEVMVSHGDPFLDEMVGRCGRALSHGPGSTYSAVALDELREIANRIHSAAAELDASTSLVHWPLYMVDRERRVWRCESLDVVLQRIERINADEREYECRDRDGRRIGLRTAVDGLVLPVVLDAHNDYVALANAMKEYARIEGVQRKLDVHPDSVSLERAWREIEDELSSRTWWRRVVVWLKARRPDGV